MGHFLTICQTYLPTPFSDQSVLSLGLRVNHHIPLQIPNLSPQIALPSPCGQITSLYTFLSPIRRLYYTDVYGPHRDMW